MNIDISNAHCGPRIQFPDHAWLRVVSLNAKLLAPLCRAGHDALHRASLRHAPAAYERSLDVRR